MKKILRIITLFYFILISFYATADMNSINEEIELIQKDYLHNPKKYETKVIEIYKDLKKNKHIYDPRDLLESMHILAEIMIYYPDKNNLGIESSNLGIELSKLNNNQNIEDFIFYKAFYTSENWGEIKEIKKLYKEAIKYALLNKNRKILTASYSYLGDLYAHEGNLKKSLDYYQKAQENYSNATELLKIKHGMSILFYKLGTYELAVEKLLEMLDIMEMNEKLEIPKKDYEIIIYQMLSLAYTKLENNEEAYKYSKKNIILSKNYYDTNFEINTYLIHAGISAKLNKNEESEKYIKKSEDMILEGKYDKNHLLISNYHFAKYYNKFSQKKYNEAKHELKKLENHLIENNISNIENIYDRLSIVLKKTGEFEEALKYQKKYTEYYIKFRNQKESLLSLFLHENYKDASLSSKIKKLEKEKLEAERKITMNLIKNIEKEKLIYKLLIVIILISIFIVFIYTYYRKDKKISLKDGLTGIFNRRFAISKIENLIKRKKDFSLILFDLDYFKKVNDTYGHDIGDKVLIKVSEIAKSQLKDKDFLCRLGGEEFLIISENKDLNLAENIRKEIEEAKFEEIKKLTASFGVIEVDRKNIKDFNFIYNELDERLYKAKDSGRNKVCYE